MTRVRSKRSALIAVGALALGLLGTQASSAPPGLDAVVVDAEFETKVIRFETIDFGSSPSAKDDRKGTTAWRTVKFTGNCCENYLTTSSKGVLFDFGGKDLHFTEDRGKTWKTVKAIEPLVNGEGAVVAAPNGDIVGVTWDPYTGDRLMSFKYEAAEKKWLYQEMPLHAPFYDREWIGVVPGPFQFGPINAPYISFIKGAYPSKEAWFMSYDGLNYAQVSSKAVDSMTSTPVEKYLKPHPNKDLDWIQANTHTGIVPLGKGEALASPDFPNIGGSWYIFNEAQKWAPFAFAEGVQPEGRIQVDSAGRLHNVIPATTGMAFDYRISPDGGATWKSVTVKLPKDATFEEWDFRANRAAGVAAMAIHGHDNKKNVDIDLLYTLDIGSNKARPIRLYRVGKGDLNASSGLGAEFRFDFETVTIFPDGRVAMSFLDTTAPNVSRTTGQPQLWPSLAIEGATKLK